MQNPPRCLGSRTLRDIKSIERGLVVGLGTKKRQPMAKVDTAWLRMESASNLMMITGVIVLAKSVSFKAFEKAIGDRFLLFERFRQKAVGNARGYWWEEDAQFELSAHIRHTALPGRADKAQLQKLVSELASTPLDQSKPLWQFHLVDNYIDGPVVIGRIHHCYADGMALVQVMLSLTEATAAESVADIQKSHWVEARAKESSLFERLLYPAKQGLKAAGQLGERVLKEGQEFVHDPEAFLGHANLVRELLAELGTLVSIEDDPPSRLKGVLGVRKNVAWAESVPLEEVKAIGYALGCTVNDVLIGVMTGALHRYLSKVGDDPAKLSMRATVPVNLRPLEHAKELGNHFGLVFLDLPIAEHNPLARVYKVSEAMNHLKSSKQAAVSLGLLSALGMAPAPMQPPALEMFSKKATTVLTNVPGPQSFRYLAGSPIKEMMFWVPQNGTIGMGISLMSYAGQVFSGLIADQNLIPDPSEVMVLFEKEFNDLLYLALLIGPMIHEMDGDQVDRLHEWIDGEV